MPVSQVFERRWPSTSGSEEAQMEDESAGQVSLRGHYPGALVHAGLRFRTRPFYFRGRTESFMALPTRNLSVVFAGIWMVSPVAGFRPSRALRSDRTSLPKPGSTNSPPDFTSEVARFERSSKNCFTCARFIPVRSAK